MTIFSDLNDNQLFKIKLMVQHRLSIYMIQIIIQYRYKQIGANLQYRSSDIGNISLKRHGSHSKLPNQYHCSDNNVLREFESRVYRPLSSTQQQKEFHLSFFLFCNSFQKMSMENLVTIRNVFMLDQVTQHISRNYCLLT